MLPAPHLHLVQYAPSPRREGARHGGCGERCVDTSGSGYPIARPCPPTVSGVAVSFPRQCTVWGELLIFPWAQGIPGDPRQHAHSLFQAPKLLALLSREQLPAFARHLAQEDTLVAQKTDKFLDTLAPLLPLLPGRTVEAPFFDRLDNG